MSDEKTYYPCREPGCVGVTTKPEGQCAPHAAGYKRHPKHGGGEIRCANCKRLINPEYWYRIVDGHVRHMAECKPHATVVAAQERERKLGKVRA